MRFPVDLPISEAIPEIRRALAGGLDAVVVAPPGAGKTTVVPLALLDEAWLSGKRIIMLEPRRLAARAAASRMATLLGEEVGATVGYRTRLDTVIGPATRVEVVTEGVLTRMLQGDPSLEGTGLLIFDEFHERSLNADLGLALALDARPHLCPALRVLVMSATIDAAAPAALLGGAPVIRSEGRAYPVEVRYAPIARLGGAYARYNESATGPSFIAGVVNAVLSALRSSEGSVLVFLPGAGEIRRARDLLLERGAPDGVDVYPLYGDLTRQAQDDAISPSPPGRRKVVLATSIAETSLTIEGVAVVVDGGYRRVARYSPSTGMGRLDTVRVATDSAEQRRGRAGRLGPGLCVRLWAESEPLLERTAPEIASADLAPLALELAVWGAADPTDLKWLTAPDRASLAHARETLLEIGAVDSSGRATEHGRSLAALPLHPRLAHMAVAGAKNGLGPVACLLAALMEERDVIKDGVDRSGAGRTHSDVRTRIDALDLARASRTDGPGHRLDRAAAERVRESARRLRRLLGVKDGPIDAEKAGRLLALAYPDRVGKRRAETDAGGGAKYLLAGGRGARLRQHDPLSSSEYIVAPALDGSGSDATVYLAAPITEAEIEKLFGGMIEESTELFWDESIDCAAAIRRRRFMAITLEEERLKSPTGVEAAKAAAAWVRKAGLKVLPWDERSDELKGRVRLLASHGAGLVDELPDLSDERLLATLEEWLAPALEGTARRGAIAGLDLSALLLKTLTHRQRRALDELAPVRVTLPGGFGARVDYTGERPVLAARMQEFFGLSSTPTIVNGRVKLLLQLLSPAGRPLQVTDDLAGFWRSGYAAVKKEMKGRYPKHHWPDDPATAATRKKRG